MREIGGYIELDEYNLSMIHEDAIALNCGRNCLAYLIRARNITKIILPHFLCDSVINTCKKEEIQIKYYFIDENFIPQNIELEDDEWLYLVNFYGQLSNTYVNEIVSKYKRVIVDQAQAFFVEPINGVDTIYTCRKFFGVPDGAFLYTDVVFNQELPLDESYDRMRFLLGRYERNASEFYGEYVYNNKLFENEPIKKMSRLTNNLLHAIDYNEIKRKRSDNFSFLHEQLKQYNSLKLKPVLGAFAYPLLVDDGVEIRKKLISQKIYIPTLWPNVLDDMQKGTLEYNMAQNILPIPCDQRYDISDMKYIVNYVKKNWRK